MEIKKTTDYDKFKSLTCNREIDEAHVERLMVAIRRRNLLPIVPVLCDSKYMVFDGQHRIEAARRLKTPVYYVSDDTLTDQDLLSLNNLKKGWKNMDYINFWTIKKQKGYEVLSRFLSEYDWLPLTTILHLLRKTDTRTQADLREGIVDVSNEKEARLILKYVQEIGNHFKGYKTRYFIRALRSVHRSGKYNHEKFIEILVNDPGGFHLEYNEPDYVRQITDVLRGRSNSK